MPDWLHAGTFISLLLFVAVCGLVAAVIVLLREWRGLQAQLARVQLSMAPAAPGQEAGGLTVSGDGESAVSPAQRAEGLLQLIADILDAAPIGIYRSRLEPGGKLWTPFMAGHLERFVRASATEVVTRPERERPNVFPEDAVRLDRAREASVANMTPIREEVRFHHVDGGTGWMRLVTGQPRRTPDGAIEWNGYWKDVTAEHSQAEALARATAQAEAANVAKSRFLAAMSHEIRTPLGAVIGALDLLRAAPLDAAHREELDIATSSAATLMQLLGDILDFSRLEAGQIMLEAVPVDLRAVLDESLVPHGGLLRGKGLTLDARVDAGVAATLRGDAVRIKQILLNLVGNAAKFTQRGGISVHIARLTPKDGMQGDAVQHIGILVRDTGMGIPPERQADLFEPFVQAESSNVRRFGGVGLGLAICRRIAESMGGDIRFDSEVGVGTTFSVGLPMPVVALRNEDPRLAGRRMRIDVAREADRQALAGYARALGMAIATDESAPPDLLVTDTARDTGLPTIRLTTTTPAPQPDGAIELRTGPIRWSALRDACLRALGIDAAPAAETLEAPLRLRTIAPVLVVEDHLPFQLIVRRQLAELGVPCEVAGDGQAALAALARQRYAMVITDCHMPNMDGFELTRRIRADEARTGGRMPVVAVSADIAREQVEQGEAAGVDEFLAKPLTRATLRSCLVRWLGA